MTLPRRLRNADPYFDKTAIQENGRWVYDRNTSYLDEAKISVLKSTLQYALKELATIPSNANRAVPVKHAEAIRNVYHALTNVDRLFPKIECWVMYDEDIPRYPDYPVAQPRAFFGFFDLDQALDVCWRWHSYYEKRWPNTQQYYVSRGHADLWMVIDPRFTNLERLEPGE